MAPQDSKIAVEILQSINNRTQSLREIVCYAWLLLTYIVIITILGRLTLDPAGMHCPSWDDAFVSSLNNVDIAANGWLLMYLLFLVAAILCIESIALSVCLSVCLSVRMYVCIFMYMYV